MFAIAFDMDIKELRTTYGEPYNNAYYEIKIVHRGKGADVGHRRGLWRARLSAARASC